MTVREEITEYINELTHENITDDNINLFESGLLTSLDVLDLINFIESKFSIHLLEENVNMDNFGSISGIVSFIEQL